MIDDLATVTATVFLLIAVVVAGCSALSDRVPGLRLVAGFAEAAELPPEDIAAGLALYCVRVPRSERLERAERVRGAARSAGIEYTPITCPGDKP